MRATAGKAVMTLTIENRAIRPGMGLPPKHFDNIVGRRLRFPVARGTATSWELFEKTEN